MGAEDQQLTNAIRSGDERAFEQVFRKYRKRLIRFAYSYVQTISVAEDLTQDAFLKVWELREALDPQSSIRAYLYQSVRNSALDYKKHQAVEEKNYMSLRLTHELQSRVEVDDTDAGEFIEAVQAAIEKLPKRGKEVYKLSRTDGLTYKEIAKVMEISVKTVESQMSRSLKLLRSALSDYLPALIIIGFIDKVII